MCILYGSYPSSVSPMPCLPQSAASTQTMEATCPILVLVLILKITSLTKYCLITGKKQKRSNSQGSISFLRSYLQTQPQMQIDISAVSILEQFSQLLQASLPSAWSSSHGSWSSYKILENILSQSHWGGLPMPKGTWLLFSRIINQLKPESFFRRWIRQSLGSSKPNSSLSLLSFTLLTVSSSAGGSARASVVNMHGSRATFSGSCSSVAFLMAWRNEETLLIGSYPLGTFSSPSLASFCRRQGNIILVVSPHGSSLSLQSIADEQCQIV